MSQLEVNMAYAHVTVPVIALVSWQHQMELYREQQLTQQNLHITAAMNQKGASWVLSAVFEMLGEVNPHFFIGGFYTSTSGQ